MIHYESPHTDTTTRICVFRDDSFNNFSLEINFISNHRKAKVMNNAPVSSKARSGHSGEKRITH